MSEVLIIPEANFQNFSFRRVALGGTYVLIQTFVTPLGKGEVIGGGELIEGSTAILNAQYIDPYYDFSEWQDGSQSNPRSIVVSQQATSYIATFEQLFTDNNFTWGLGGILRPGASSGTQGKTIAMIDPNGTSGGLIHATKRMVLRCSDDFYIQGYYLSPNYYSYNQTQAASAYYSGNISEQQRVELEIPYNYYYQVAITKRDASAAYAADGPTGLLVREFD